MLGLASWVRRQGPLLDSNRQLGGIVHIEAYVHQTTWLLFLIEIHSYLAPRAEHFKW